MQQQPWQQRQARRCRRGSLAVTASAAGAGALVSTRACWDSGVLGLHSVDVWPWCSLLSLCTACTRCILSQSAWSRCPLPLQNPEERTAAQKVVAFKEAFWKFLRPHTIRGTILGSSAVTAIALLENTGVSTVGRSSCWPCCVLLHKLLESTRGRSGWEGAVPAAAVCSAGWLPVRAACCLL